MDKPVYLDICNYNREILCNIYDSTIDVQGQAVDFFKEEERNGWKEITFTMPCKINTENGSEDNYRVDYIKADYKLRISGEGEPDWYLITELGIHHDQHHKTIEVTAGHVSQLLKYRALSLEFSDDEGNNTGTAEELLTEILRGTGWHVGEVANFYEKDGETIKVRSLQASIKTGAFKLIEMLCDKFDARPVYHGETNTVDIFPINPFSEKYETGTIPKEVINDKILEITYGINAKNIKRTYNAETIITKLFAYGSYGDMNGYCAIDSATHHEYKFMLGQFEASLDVGIEFYFTDIYGDNYYFQIEEDVSVSKEDEFVWSDFDFLSRSYVWNNTKQNILHVYKQPQKLNHTQIIITSEEVDNLYPFLINIDYYRNTKLLSEETFREIAAWQRNSTQFRRDAREAQRILSEKKRILSETAEHYTGFLMLGVSGHESTDDNKLKLIIDVENGDEGVLWRSDYGEKRRKYFPWHVSAEMKENGDPVNSEASVVYIVHNTDPITWEKVYVRKIYDPEGNVYRNDKDEPADFSYALDSGFPTAIDLWTDYIEQHEGDRYYLFCTNSISGRLGQLEILEESMRQALDKVTKELTETHPLIISDTAPEIELSENTVVFDVYTLMDYAWWYKPATDQQFGELYFMYTGFNDTTWKQIHISNHDPDVVNSDYYFNFKLKVMYHGENGKWVKMEDSKSLSLVRKVSVVISNCRRRDMIMKGYYEQILYCVPEGGLPAGNYAFDFDYGYMEAFTTDRDIAEGEYICYDNSKNILYQTVEFKDGVAQLTIDTAGDAVGIDEMDYSAITFPIENIIPSKPSSWPMGYIDETGKDKKTSWNGRSYRCMSTYVNIYPNTTYQYHLPYDAHVVIYDQNKTMVEWIALPEKDGIFTTNGRAYFYRIFYAGGYSSSYYSSYSEYTDRVSNATLHVYNWENTFYAKDVGYTVLSGTTGVGELISLASQLHKFVVGADEVKTAQENLKAAQNVVEEKDLILTDLMGDAMREGTWQENTYVEGDEDKLYDDAMDNLKEMSQPDVDYEIDYLELFGANREMDYNLGYDTEWPDVDISFAVHLIDEDLNLNQWAYIDKLNKCIDQRQKTTLTINTKLSLIRQHDFHDVLTRIADVANEVKAKQSIYSRAKVITATGAVDANKVSGVIDLSKITFSNTVKGSFVFESSDNSAAIMFNSSGFYFASTKNSSNEWIWTAVVTSQNVANDNNSVIRTSATVDGYQAAGRVRTEDGLIEITPSVLKGQAIEHAEDGVTTAEADTPAKVVLKDGAKLDVEDQANIHRLDSDYAYIDTLYVLKNGQYVQVVPE